MVSHLDADREHLRVTDESYIACTPANLVWNHMLWHSHNVYVAHLYASGTARHDDRRAKDANIPASPTEHTTHGERRRRVRIEKDEGCSTPSRSCFGAPIPRCTTAVALDICKTCVVEGPHKVCHTCAALWAKQTQVREEEVRRGSLGVEG